MIDHVALHVSDYAASKAFYEAALAPLGYGIVMEMQGAQHGLPFGGACGLGAGGKPDFWIVQREPVHTGVHVAFGSPDRQTVHAFHEAALRAGGTDNGPPGPRPHYHQHYYAAFAHDPDGNNVEAVCHEAPAG